MTTEQFNKKSYELIEKIQDLETETLLLRYELYNLKKEYQQEQVIDKSVENFKKFAEKHNQEMKKDLVTYTKELKDGAFQEWLEAAKALVALNNSLFKDKIEEQREWEQGGEQ